MFIPYSLSRIVGKMEKRKILYLDDEKDNLDVFEYSFAREYQLYLASTILEAKNILKENDIEVIITDYKMPEMTGVDFLESIHKDNPHCIRIILTGFHDYEIVVNSINRAKIFQFVTKPWKKQDFKIIIDNALELYGLRERNNNLIKHLIDSNNDLQVKSQSLKNIAEIHSKEIENFEKITAHNLRGPVRSIGTLVEWLINDYADLYDSNAHEYLNLLKIRIQQLYDSMDGVLEYIKTGLIPIGQQTLLSQTVDKIRKSDWFKDHIQIELLTDTFPMDPDHTFSVMKETLKNALDATVSSSGKIILTCWKSEGESHLKVSDNGRGIEEKYHKKIFQTFQSISDENSNKLGLGLAIVDKIAKLYRGNISFVSTPGKGTTITLSLKNILP